MNNEERFFKDIDLAGKFIEEMLITGADVYAIEELLFGWPPLPGSWPCRLHLPTGFTQWRKHLAEVD